ncbi:hypothetical protein BV22DRAFT_1060927 [Leucogyrophana mollusca]|uniref:Uncharacterized protein n=1 Tax=Leucogyrophana mollusca TaxID=85980 RepID=A0ACB8BPL9_9AGAM|nr:hypothetical protein BV22DRAFT_1060927 [Leucogyrophana mollusca]
MSYQQCYPSDWTLLVLSPTFDTPSDAPIALGYALSLVFFGILFVQAFIYHTRFPEDQPWIKAYVWSVVFLEWLSCAFGLYGLWMGSEMHCLSCIPFALPNLNVVGGTDGNPTVAIVKAAQWSWIATAVLTGLISFMVHGFFCWRIRVIGKHIYVPIFVMAVRMKCYCIVDCSLSMIHLWQISLAQFALIVIAGNGPLVNESMYRYLWLGGSFICDIVITFETTRLLFRRKSEPGFRETRSLVLKLVKLTIETGMVTTIAILLEFLLAWFLGPTDHLAVYFSISRLYANCLLATLNARLVISKDSTHVQQVSTALFVAPNVSVASERLDLSIRRRNAVVAPSSDIDIDTPSFHLSTEVLDLSGAECAEGSYKNVSSSVFSLAG